MPSATNVVIGRQSRPSWPTRPSAVGAIEAVVAAEADEDGDAHETVEAIEADASRAVGWAPRVFEPWIRRVVKPAVDSAGQCEFVS